MSAPDVGTLAANAPADKPGRSRIVYIDALRIFSIFAVVVLHVSAANINATTIGGPTWWILNMGDSMTRWSVPVFFMASGLFFLDPRRDVTVKKLLTKSVPHIVIAYFTWSFVYALYAYFIDGHPFAYALDIFVYGELHEWFLQDLLIFYLLTPLLRLVTARPRLYRTVLFAGIALVFGVNTYNLFAATPLPLSFDYTAYGLYFMLGLFLRDVPINKGARVALYAVAVLTVALVAVLTRNASVEAQITVNAYFGNTNFLTFVPAVAVFVAFRHSRLLACAQGRTAQVISLLGVWTFGIYLVHLVFLGLFERFAHLSAISPNVVIGFPLSVALIFGASVATAALLKRIPVLGRWIV